MYYMITTNQIAIVNFNKSSPLKLDWADGYIIEYLQKQTTSNFAKKNFVIKDNEIYFLLCYDNIIKQLPLLNIETKDAIGRRIKKLKTLEIINHYVDKKNHNKVYFNTTDLFETFFSYDQTVYKPNPHGLQTESLSVHKPNHIYDNNIKDNNIKEDLTCVNFTELKGTQKNSTVSKMETVENTKTQIITKVENDFLELWKLYGKIGCRQEALKSFIKAEKKVSIDKIKKGIETYLSYLENIKTSTFYPIKNFSTWLNQERWNHEYEIQNTKSKYARVDWSEIENI